MGRRYTWSNECSTPTLVHLDRVFSTMDWEAIYPNCMLHSMTVGISDHCPLLLGLNAYQQGKCHFHFEAFWPHLPGFKEMVQQAWAACPGRANRGPLERLADKFQHLTRCMQSWSQKQIGNVRAQLDQAMELLHRLEIARDIRGLNQQEEWLCKKLKLHSLALAYFQRTIARVRARVDWLSEGDANTSFFHAHARYRKRKNFIATLQDGERLVTDHDTKEEVVWNYYNNLLGTTMQRSNTLNLPAFYQPPQDLQALEAPISTKEVGHIVMQLPLDKSLGPDGFTGRFYRVC